MSKSVNPLWIVVTAFVAIVGCSPRAEERARTDEVYIAIAAGYLAAHDQQVFFTELVGDKSVYRTYPAVSYTDGAALRASNPDCCVIGPTISSGARPHCIRNGSAVEISISWDRKYHRPDGSIGSHPDTIHLGVREDGSVCAAEEEALK